MRNFGRAHGSLRHCVPSMCTHCVPRNLTSLFIRSLLRMCLLYFIGQAINANKFYSRKYIGIFILLFLLPRSMPWTVRFSPLFAVFCAVFPLMKMHFLLALLLLLLLVPLPGSEFLFSKWLLSPVVIRSFLLLLHTSFYFIIGALMCLLLYLLIFFFDLRMGHNTFSVWYLWCWFMWRLRDWDVFRNNLNLLCWYKHIYIYVCVIKKSKVKKIIGINDLYIWNFYRI